jgi:hypothetical protein
MTFAQLGRNAHYLSNAITHGLITCTETMPGGVYAPAQEFDAHMNFKSFKRS